MPEATTYLNLGCGSRYHPDWINIDIAPHDQEVIQHDLSRGIPLPDSSCDVVYHSAVLEHLRRSGASLLLSECYRVLKPGGIVRVGVPDLERICQLYLSRLTSALKGDESAAHDYDWIMMELFDQSVREKSGGEMLSYLRENPLPNEAFVYDRIGEYGRQLVNELRGRDNSGRERPYEKQQKLKWLGIKKFLSKCSDPAFVQKLRSRLRDLPGVARQRMLWKLLRTDDRRALEIGRLRLSGEVHQWMYDRYSLALLLRATGFHDPQVKDAKTSRIPNWTSFHLDTLSDGQVIKPDSFFMEAIKQAATINEKTS